MAVGDRRDGAVQSGRWHSCAWLLPVGIGALVRLLYPLAADFPLNDGGMFLVMVQDLVVNGFRLPVETSYNRLHIPFAYPPAAFYLAGLLSYVWPLIDILRVLPPLLSLAAVPVYAMLASDILAGMLPGKQAGHRGAWIATLAYALIPASFQWQIMGGGLTRSLGYLAALSTLWLVRRYYAYGSRQYGALAAVAVALALSSHPELGWFTVFSLALLFLISGLPRGRQAITRTAAIVLLAGFLCSPWWLSVLLRHGPGPYLAAFSTGEHGRGWALPFQATGFSGEPWLSVWAVLGLWGILICLRDRQWLLPLWLLLVYVLDPRKGMSLGTVPLAMMIGYGVERSLRPEFGSRLGKAALAAVVTYTTIAALALPVMPVSSWPVLPPGERAAMSWAHENTPPGSRWVVIGSSWLWARDQAGEWFPALADRQSLTTVQGREWLPGDNYETARRRFALVRSCRAASCLQHIGPHDYVYVSKTPVGVDAGVTEDLTLALRRSLTDSTHYRLVFSNADAEVFAVR